MDHQILKTLALRGNAVGANVSDFEFTGAFKEFEYLTEEMGRLASQKFMNTFIDEVSKAALALIKKQFVTSVDLYGKPWAPFKSKKDLRSGRKLLDKSGTLKNSIRRQVTRDGFKIFVSGPAARYFEFHQWGTKNMAQRLILPPTGGDLPQARGVTNDDISPFIALLQQAAEITAQKLDLDIFAETSGASTAFERERNFRDDY